MPLRIHNNQYEINLPSATNIYLMMQTPQSFLVVIAALWSISLAETDQKLLGQSFEPLTHISTNTVIREAVLNITNSLNSAIRTGKNHFGSFNSSTTSFSLTAISQLDSTPIVDFHHTSGSLNASAGSTSRVTGDTVYRIGSVSKLFTVYSLLLNNGTNYWNRPVTEFIPELRTAAQHPPYKSSVIDSVQWDQVTVGALASQLSGIGRDCMFSALLSSELVLIRMELQIAREIYRFRIFLGHSSGYLTSLLKTFLHAASTMASYPVPAKASIH